MKTRPARSFAVRPGKRVTLSSIDPRDTEGVEHDDRLRKKIKRDLEALSRFQELLYAARTDSILVVLQGIDTAGKDGTIRHVFSLMNPLGCRAVAFKEPDAGELAHDYLWRVHRQAPARGQFIIFNRSHYESVLVERVHRLVPPEVWRPRYDEINDFERLLMRNGTIVFKFFLHISKKEQKNRLIEREADPDKTWKSDPKDWKERRLWGDYRRAFDDMLSRTSTRWAPWHVIPADHKWFRNFAVAETLVRRLAAHASRWQKDLHSRFRK
jgi:PPK2 family polyphosphate:nucleotide phosphotransferase